MKTIFDFAQSKKEKSKISMITCYDHWSAKIVNQSDIDCILVGDSAAMVVHGHSSTLSADTDLMALHTSAVAKGAPDKFIVGDLPFLSYRKSLSENITAVEKIMKAGAHAVKLEGAKGNLELVSHLVESGVPVMGHLGLTPQSIHQLGGFKVQGKNNEQADKIIEDCLSLEKAGCFSLVLECVPTRLAETITENLTIPTIGIGAGPFTDGQVLVMQDMLGMNPDFKPRFLKTYLSGFEQFKSAFNEFNREVKDSQFPSIKESYE